MTVNIARQQLRLVSSLHASVFTFLALKFAPPSPQGMQLVSTDRIGQDEALKNVQTAPLNILFELHGLAHEMSISVMWNCNLKKKKHHSISAGYRHIPLLTKGGDVIPSAKLFVHIMFMDP